MPGPVVLNNVNRPDPDRPDVQMTVTHPPPVPRVVATIGLHGSASTWVFNVVRELVGAAVGEDRVLSCFADEMGQLPDPSVRAGRRIVVKSHHGSAGLDDWLRAMRARTVLSVRDPRDAAVSTARRFEASVPAAARAVLADAERLMRLAGPAALILRYEDRFFDDPAAVDAVAAHLGITVDADTRQGIFERYRTEAVRAFAAALGFLPAARLTTVGRFPMDRLTQILGPHIGDTSSDKWRALPGAVQRSLTGMFGPFLDRFGYER